MIKFCEVCGVSSEKKIVGRSYGKLLCEKHRIQYSKYGKFFDSNQITVKDPNEIILADEKHAYILLYDKYGNVTAKTIIDAEDIGKVRDYRWMACEKRKKIYVRANNSGNIIYLHRLLLDYDGEDEVDHIDGDSLNNTKENLRVVSRINNVKNVAPRYNGQIGIRGVSFDKRYNAYTVDFSYQKNRFYMKTYKKLEQAVYLRFLCESYYLLEYRYKSNDGKIKEHISRLSETEKREIEDYFEEIKMRYAERIS